MINFHFKLLLLLLLNQLLVGCKEKCNSNIVERRPIAQEVKDYFGSYNTGSYWVYQNQDSTKTDSVSVSSYSHRWQRSVTLCKEDEIIEFQFNSNKKYVLTSGFCCAKIAGGSANVNACPNSTLLYDIDKVEMQGNKFYSDAHNCTTLSAVTINGIDYSGEILKITLQQISEQGDLYVRKNGGIIGWATPSDTFSLIKQNIVL